MGVLVVTGAICSCPFGTAPGRLTVDSQSGCLAEGKPAATIMDMKPGGNISSFGMCISMANPAVASATAAALGVLTPQPCTMVPAGTWVTTRPKVLVGGKPCLTDGSVLTCAMGLGIIKITMPGQFKVLV